MLRTLLSRVLSSGAEAPAALRRGAREAAQAGDVQGARALLERALALEPGSPDAHSDLGNVHALLGEDAQAERCYAAALERAPDHGAALVNLAALRARRGDRAGALEGYRRALGADPWSERALDGLVGWLPDDAVPHADIALVRAIAERHPDHAAAHAALGRLHLRGSFDCAPALEHLERALALGRRDADTLAAYGVALHETGRFDDALAAYDAALAAAPEHMLARFHRATTLLTLGRFGAAWPDYELRLVSEDRPRRVFPFPRWQGEDLGGRTILVHAEQGIGDEILFASCLPQLIARARRCVIECAPKLAPIFARSFPSAKVHAGLQSDPVDWAAPLGIDVQISVGSLPLHLRRNEGAFPPPAAYLRADATKVERWRERLRALGTGRAIGVSWRGGTTRTRTERRSLALDELAPLLRLPGHQFVSLQYGDGAAAELAQLAGATGFRVHHWPEAIDDYDETAALATALDGIVSVCTAIVHLGGALGRPVWVATPRVPEWRYGAQGERMPWYPNVRLRRQTQGGDWAPVVDAIRRDLLAAASP
jgi:tetratricopeptide (TPR) repeat protein